MTHNSNISYHIIGQKVSVESGGVWEATLQNHPMIQQLEKAIQEMVLCLVNQAHYLISVATMTQ